MQKKREEKRRLKQEKALERKKKKNRGMYPAIHIPRCSDWKENDEEFVM